MDFAHRGDNAADATDVASNSGAGAAANGGSTASAWMLAQMLDIVDYGVVLVHADGQVGFANRCARAELGLGSVLQMAGGALQAQEVHDATALAAALDAAIRRGMQRLLKLRGDGTTPLLVSVLPVGVSGGDGSHNSPGCALVVLGKRTVCVDLSADEFGRRHGVTSAELRVMKQLSAGCPASEIARSQGVALSTVRTQISSLRGKTGADSIVALIRQVASLPPLASRELTTACAA